ncbi:MAG: hypothetical protein JW873_04940 [Candidatus Saganbacteria bacterium]|nr:hypothetical protein [Candidatus Saganbacteria bacterium]
MAQVTPEAASPEAAPVLKLKEIYRIKVWNQAGGTVEVSADRGKNWQRLGKVVAPTVQTNPHGYAAARWVPDGQVAATAVNAIHLKTSTEADGRAVIFSLLPKEFYSPPRDYRSYFSADASIYTDIPAGTGIFGGEYAPLVGNRVMVHRAGYVYQPVPPGYVPWPEDRIYLIVEVPVDYPREIEIENRAGGRVVVAYFNGETREVGSVVFPARGIGRFEGSKYASAGRVRANHAGVLDVSTSPLGSLGGFQIIPAGHAAALKYAYGAPQWLVVAPLDGEPSLEGRAPLFRAFIKPDYLAADLFKDDWEARLLDRFLVDVKLKDDPSGRWRPLPVCEFPDYYLTGGVPEKLNNALSNVAEIRILFPVNP